MLHLKKTLLPTFFLIVICMHNVFAQSKPADSSKIIRKAQKFARSFRLDAGLQQKFIAANFPASSDYFKPGTDMVSEPALLKDSLFVKTFKEAAFANTQKMLKNNSGVPAVVISAPEVSSATMSKARDDARGFTLSADALLIFKNDKLTPSSDYFKPTSFYAANSESLRDSDYNKAFRYVAYTKTSNKVNHTGSKALLVALGVIGIGVGLFVALFAIFGAH